MQLEIIISLFLSTFSVIIELTKDLIISQRSDTKL